jgi:hypothetical protein
VHGAVAFYLDAKSWRQVSWAPIPWVRVPCHDLSGLPWVIRPAVNNQARSEYPGRYGRWLNLFVDDRTNILIAPTF